MLLSDTHPCVVLSLYLLLATSCLLILFPCKPQFRMSAGGDSGQKGPAVSAQEAQMQAIMQQARVTVHTHKTKNVTLHMSELTCVHSTVMSRFSWKFQNSFCCQIVASLIFFLSSHSHFCSYSRCYDIWKITSALQCCNFCAYIFNPVSHLFLLVFSLLCVDPQVQWVWPADPALWCVSRDQLMSCAKHLIGVHFKTFLWTFVKCWSVCFPPSHPGTSRCSRTEGREWRVRSSGMR